MADQDAAGGLPPGFENVPLIGGADTEEALMEAGRRTGLLCAGCGGSLEQQGWEYLTLRPEMREGTPKIIISKAFICNHERCAQVRARLERSATARRPWAPWHIFEDAPTPPTNGNGEEQPQAGPDAEQETMWNGEPCLAERCVVVVGEVGPDHWAHPFIGTERNAVMVKLGEMTIYLDDEGFELSEEAQSLAKSRGQKVDAKMGFPGWGWHKVTKGRGSPAVGHADFPVERIVSTAHDQSV